MTRKSDLTTAQAQDLARHFLGREWGANFYPRDRLCQLYVAGDGRTANSAPFFEADTWRAVFRLAGVKLPVRPQFVAIKERIMQADKCVGVMTSPTFAARTANALNEYEPDRRGL